MRSISEKDSSVTPANHILQFVYSTYDNFRFPIAYFPTTGATSQELFFVVWKVIGELKLWDFDCDYISVDGANSNRTLWSNLLGKARSTSYRIQNLHCPSRPLVLIMDPSHVIKCIRNCISSSGFSKFHSKLLYLNGKFIAWDHWIQAYNFDKNVNNGMRVHPKLTDEHLFLTRERKMHVHLAQDALGQDMLNLMMDFAKSCPDSSQYDSTIQLLKVTSKLIDNVCSNVKIHDVSHAILLSNNSILEFFNTWEKQVLISQTYIYYDVGTR